MKRDVSQMKHMLEIIRIDIWHEATTDRATTKVDSHIKYPSDNNLSFRVYSQ